MTLSLVELMKVEPFSVNVDGSSNDNHLLKLYPLNVLEYLTSTGGVCVSDFFMCFHPVFQLLMDEALIKMGLEWSRCVGFS